MNKNATLPTFEEIVEYYGKHIGKKLKIGKPAYAQIPTALPKSLGFFSHFEIMEDDKNKRLCIEFHIEKDDNNTKELQIAIKYWKSICVLGKPIQYDKRWRNCGRLRIFCNYSEGKEKLCAYINEFIYQIKSRIDYLSLMGTFSSK